MICSSCIKFILSTDKVAHATNILM